MNATHGGDVGRVARLSGHAPEDILDFSANVNPCGLPPRAIERLLREVRDGRALTQYPDTDAIELRTALAERLHVGMENIVVGAGADALIHAAVRALAPKRCVIPIPAFAEYDRACAAANCTVERIPLMELAAFEAQTGDLVFLNNPHNPTGACASRGEMLDRIGGIRRVGAEVLADEAFVDYVPECAITSEAAVQIGVISIRSLTKFFGCAGLRVGYAVAEAEMAAKLSAQLPAWPVTTLALDALAEAVRDEAYISATIEANVAARTRLLNGLARLVCGVFPPSANFIFFELPEGFDAAEVRTRLIEQFAILVRECSSFEGLERGRYLRVAVRRDEENRRLLEALAAVFGQLVCQQRA